MPSQKELAEIFAASLITIKRALYELVQENLLYSQPGKGVFVGKHIPNITKFANAAGTIGVLLSETMSLLFPSILTAIESKARRQNYLVIISSPSGDVDEEKRQMTKLLGIWGYRVSLSHRGITVFNYSHI